MSQMSLSDNFYRNFEDLIKLSEAQFTITWFENKVKKTNREYQEREER